MILYNFPPRTGGDGVICGMTNVEPETFVTLHRAYEAIKAILKQRISQASAESYGGFRGSFLR